MSHDLEERLATELGDVAYRMPPPPLADVHRRAGRRRRNRLARRGAGLVAVAAVGSFAVTTSTSTFTDRPIQPGPGTGTEQGCATAAVAPRTLDPWLLRLPDRVPAGTEFRQTMALADDRRCDPERVTAWHETASGTIDRWVEVTGVMSPDGPGERCEAFQDMFDSGECRQAEVAGGMPWAWWSRDGDRAMVTWLDDGRLWSVSAYGYGAAAFAVVVDGVRVSGGRVVAASLPDGLQRWKPPITLSPPAKQFEARYSVPPDRAVADEGDVMLTVTDDPYADPFARMGGPGTTREVVKVDDRPGLWIPDGDGAVLTWRGPNDLVLSLSSDSGLTLAEALAVAESVRQVTAEDPRLTCDPRNKWGGCEGPA